MQILIGQRKKYKSFNEKRNKNAIKKYNYPPEYRKTAVENGIKQAEFMMSE